MKDKKYRYSVLLEKKLLPGVKTQDALVCLMEKFDLDRESIAAIMRSSDMAIFREGSYDDAKKAFNTATTCGFRCRVVKSEASCKKENKVFLKFVNKYQKAIYLGLGGICSLFFLFFIYKQLPFLDSLLSTEKYIGTNIQQGSIKKEQRLYTGFLRIPVVFRAEGYLKRDLFNRDKKLLGVCVRTFEVAIGYENLDDIISDICAGNEAQKTPIFLDLNPINETSKGKGIERTQCSSIDLPEKREDLYKMLNSALKEAELLDEVIEQGSSALTAFAGLFCPQE